jgi:Cu/Zn superoxide dismutase
VPDDTLIDGDILYVVQVAVDTVNTLDANFATLPAQDVNATNADDDIAGFTLKTATLSTTEVGGTDTFTVGLGRTTERRCGFHYHQQRYQRRHT